jgi:hypothetical protein
MGERCIEFRKLLVETLAFMDWPEPLASTLRSCNTGSEHTVGCSQQQLRWQGSLKSALPNPEGRFCHPTHKQSYCPAAPGVYTLA